MKIAFDITHPSDVHQFKNCIKILQKQECKIFVTARENKVIQNLLEHYQIEYTLRKNSAGLIGRILNLFFIVSHLIREYKIFQPDILVGGSGNIYIPITAKILGRKSIVFDDTEHTKIQNLIVFKLATLICTPECYKIKIGKKQKHYKGSKELTYLHPNTYNFVRDEFHKELLILLKQQNKQEIIKDILNNIKLVLIRLVAWSAFHDLTENHDVNWVTVINRLKQIANVVVITDVENNLIPIENVIDLPAHLYHNLINYADIIVTEGASTAAEAAVLGKPAIYCNHLKVGYIDEYDKTYGLIEQISDEKLLCRTVEEYIADNKIDTIFQHKRNKMLQDKADISKWIVNLIYNELSAIETGDPKSIAFISNIDPRYLRIGGIESYVRELSNTKIKKGYRVDVIGVSEVPKKYQDNFTLEKLNSTNSMRFNTHYPVYYNDSPELTTSFQFLSRLILKGFFIKINNFDILHFQRPDFALPFIFRKNKKICTIHGNPAELIRITKRKFHFLLYNIFEWITLRYFDEIKFVDNKTYNRYLKKYPKQKLKMEIVYPKVGNHFIQYSTGQKNDLRKKYGFAIDDKIILFVGRFEKEKSVLQIIRIFKDIFNNIEFKNCKLLLVGYGSLKNEIEKYVDNSHIFLFGATKNGTLPEFYNIANATILYSKNEGMPLVVLESLACGTPVISNKAGDITNLIKDGYNGYLINGENVSAQLTSKISLLHSVNPDNCVASVPK